MKYKRLIFSLALIGLTAASVFLASISVNPKNISGPNAKREYAATSEISIEVPQQSESNIAHQTLTFPNAKREKI